MRERELGVGGGGNKSGNILHDISPWPKIITRSREVELNSLFLVLSAYTEAPAIALALGALSRGEVSKCRVGAGYSTVP